MRMLIRMVLGCSMLVAVASAQQVGQAQPAAPELKTAQQKGSYGLGVSIGNNLKRAGFELDLSLLMRGLSDALAGAKPALTQQEIQESIVAMQQESIAKAAEKNKAEGAAFHTKIGKEKGIVTTKSGLQYKVVKAGDGKVSPKATDTVSTHYKGTLLNGNVFDDSYARGEPVSFPVGQVIKGWTEALQLMKVGDKWQLFIPGNLGYGENGNPQAGIGPNATLLFDIELLAIETPK